MRFGIIRDFYRAPLVSQVPWVVWIHSRITKCGPTPFTIANQDPGGGDGALEDATEEVLPYSLLSKE